MTRSETIALAAIVWSMGLALWYTRPWPRAVFLAVAAFVLWVAVAPGRPYDPEALRRDNVACLRTFPGTRYVWGGENRLGIDCSGLVREGMIDATMRRGVATLNPHLIRTSVWMWWHDCSAADLGEGYRGRTRLLFEATSLQATNYSRLLPGDIAVTEGGAHTMAYLGNRTWIEADPGEPAGQKVITLRVPTSRNPWLQVPMRLLRWRLLDQPA